LIAAFMAGTLVGAISVVQIVPNYKGTAAAGPQESVAAGGADARALGLDGNGSALSGQDGPTMTTSGSATTTGGSPPPEIAAKLKCAAGQNGGSTDQGVMGDQIRLATTVVESGIGRPFLRDVRFAMEAVKNEVNRTGGICGRKLRIEYVDDGWEPSRGASFLGNFINEPNPAKKIFAIPIGPSSEGLRVVISRGDIDRAKIPVVGADGMLIDQYVKTNNEAQPWVWPVASATVASARIMAQQAWKEGAKSFGIVFDKNYRFGQEAAKAFNAEVRRLTKNDVAGYNGDNNCQKRYCGIQAGLSSYPNEVREFYREKADFIALFLEPQTALTWMGDPNTPNARYSATDESSRRYGAAQPLFTREFADKCKEKCDQMTVWTGFKPYIETHKSDPAVQKYVADLRRTNPQADIYNAFAVGGYVGMQLLVQALKQVGPYLTREGLRKALNTMTLSTGLTMQAKLQWRPNWRYVNTTMQGFIIQYRGTFGGWREGPIGKDPQPAAGIN
jgi:ABC-type branched-subunit amino acid transport system substrate-binding protein